MFVTETHLIIEVLDEEINIENFNVFRSDRTERKCGGAAIIIHESLLINESKIHRFSSSCCEMIIIHIEELDLHTICIYRPPDSTSDKFIPCLEELDKYLETVHMSDNILIMGDMNFPFLGWNEVNGSVIHKFNSGGTRDEQSQAQALLNLSDRYFLNQVIKEPTRINNIIDLAFTNNQDLLTNINVDKVTNQISDHNLIIGDLNYEMPNSNTCKRNETTSNLASFNFWSEKVNWTDINNHLNNIQWDQHINSDTSVTSDINFLYDELFTASSNHIPKKKRKLYSMIPRDRKILFRRNKFLKRKLVSANKQKKADKIESEIIDNQKEILKSYEAERKAYESKLIKGIKKNSKLFFKYAKKFAKKPQVIGPLKDSNGKLVSDPQEMCEIINSEYDKNFNKNKHTTEVSLDNASSESTINISDLFSDEAPFTEIEITEDDLINAIKSTKINSAPGSDGVPPILLHKCAQSLVKPLKLIFKKSLENGDIPEIWKEAIITPIYKRKGDKSDPSQYRPISLTSQIIKLLERILRVYIIQYMEINNNFPDSQHGFRSGRSTVSQLLQQYDRILEALEKNANIDIIMLDYSKAFNKINHSILLHKLKNLGISGSIGQWIGQFLINRNQRVSIQGFKSGPSKVMSGVPQGTILGPLLFLIYIADIGDNITDCTLSSYADDSKADKIIQTVEDGEILQTEVNKLYTWTSRNLMEFNTSKFEVLRIGKNKALKDEITYKTPEGKPIPETEVVKDLCVLFNNEGHFGDHIKVKSAKGKQMSGYIFRTFLTRKPEIMLTLLKSLVLPIIEYSCIVWNPHAQKDIVMLESVQRTFTCKLDGMSDLNYYQRLQALNLYSTERRRDRYILMYVFKIIQGRVPNPGISYKWSARRGKVVITPPVPSSKQSRAATLLHNSFSRRAPRIFNAMPQSLRNISDDTSKDSIKRRIDLLLKKIPDEPRLPGYYPSNNSASNRLEDQIRVMERLSEDHH